MMFGSRKTSDSLKTECGRIRIIAIRTEFSEAHIIMLTTFEGDVRIQRAFETGAHTHILKTMPPEEIMVKTNTSGPEPDSRSYWDW